MRAGRATSGSASNQQGSPPNPIRVEVGRHQDELDDMRASTHDRYRRARATTRTPRTPPLDANPRRSRDRSVTTRNAAEAAEGPKRSENRSGLAQGRTGKEPTSGSRRTIDALATLKRLLDDDTADNDDIRDEAVRAVNRFDASIAAHQSWRPYSRAGSSNPDIRDEAGRLARHGVERHPEYRGRLRRRLNGTVAMIEIRETPQSIDNRREPHAAGHRSPDASWRGIEWRIELRHDGPWKHVSTTRGPLANAEMIGARRLAKL